MDEFTVDLDRHGDIVVIRLHGELDLRTAPTLRDCLAVALSQLDAPIVVVDASRLTFCDSSGVSVLLSGYGLAKAAGGHLALSCVGGRLTRVLEVTGLISHFQIFPTTHEALAELR
ncbi:STAS domain-containing protein [Nonomuraea soli]|uniref:Anti-sigma factor antagonist n=1 Tax=Nonomuraea soli TaxID=1032476 RepID=A0A7W0CFN0_9ACTN|nr:STAS domain-containing protein [Nonomuraea soli]MBA2890236.1 anti-sigma B factor antagonist [Nonomuraea soli]